MLPSQTGPCQTSSHSLVFGLGPSITSENGIITGAKLPTGRQILRCMLAKKPGANGALSQFEATKGVLEQVRPFYKMVDLVNANNKLRKISQAKRSSETTAKQLEKMECKLDATFPLWPPNVEKLIDNPEDLAFLASMKTDRVSTFGVLDKKLQREVKRREERQATAAARQSRCEKELEEMTAMSSLVSESDEEPEEDANTVCPTSEGEPSHKRKKTGTNVFIPHDILSQPSVVSLATRLKMSPTQQAAFKRGLVAESGGAEEQTAVTFQRPGALHKARWMAKLLYTLKLALMKQHIALLPQGTITTRHQVPKIRAFVIFITHIYAKWWLTCEKSVDAAWNDLTLYQHLQAYKAVDEGIAASAIKALERHRWYLTGEMLPLALFSSKVPNEDKRALASAILEHKPADLPMHIPEQCFGTGFGKPKFPTLLPTTSLADLANKDCWFGIHQLHIDPEFMSLDVKEWATNAAFKKSEVNVCAMNVVNDCAERGVKLTSDFVAVARKEQHLQNVLQAVEHDRSQQPNLRRCKRKVITSLQ
ncbi:hypothetical protein JOQ06_025673 [Pogonophryne albipinna]|uniref:Uncharacterized protein n=1 Tax=Pogonophryne albipinna TaxID=1090488 RepID=A0AAD6AU33_9TELE|nr:hypothetical protein JOQ06_025673 [Pogonophryne albipinna]